MSRGLGLPRKIAPMPSETGAPDYTIEVNAKALAAGIYRELRQTEGALVQGEPGDGDLTLIDGNFDLEQIAQRILNRFGKAE